MDVPVDLVVPVKELRRAKSRLVGAVADLPGDDADRDHAHRGLALALARDTLRAATAAGVRRVVVVTAEPAGSLDVGSVEFVDDPGTGLNAAVRHGAEHLQRTTRGRPGLVAALQADLPALRPAELDAALAQAAAVIAGGATTAFVADHSGTGTTLLVGRVLRPRFGVGSAAAHAAAGGVALDETWPGLRADVDTPDDLARVRALGTGPSTRAWLAGAPVAGGRAGGVDRVNAGADGCDARPGSLAGSSPLGQNPGT